MLLPRLYILFRLLTTVMYNILNQFTYHTTAFVCLYLSLTISIINTGVTPLPQAAMHLSDLIFLYGRMERYSPWSSAARHEWRSAGDHGCIRARSPSSARDIKIL